VLSNFVAQSFTKYFHKVTQSKSIIYANLWIIRVNTNGNFRALSYDDNRSDSNQKSPKVRFEKDQNIKDSFVSESNLKHWKNLEKTELNTLTMNLLKFSYMQ